MEKVSKNEISYNIVQTIVRDLAEERATPIIDQEEFITQAFALAVKERMTVYDVLFVVATRGLKTELITSDRKRIGIARIQVDQVDKVAPQLISELYRFGYSVLEFKITKPTLEDVF